MATPAATGNNGTNHTIEPTNLLDAYNSLEAVTHQLNDPNQHRRVKGASATISTAEWMPIQDLMNRDLGIKAISTFREAILKSGRNNISAENIAKGQSSFLALGGTVVAVVVLFYKQCLILFILTIT